MKTDPYEQILQRNKEWVSQTLALDPHYFEKLGKGQSPLILYFGCSDSRIPINILTGTEPGGIFIHRNVANQFQSEDLCAQFDHVVGYSDLQSSPR
jgi:carbonic anhydrase